MIKVPEKIFIGSPKGFEKFKADVMAKFERNDNIIDPTEFPCIAVCTVINENDGYFHWTSLNIKYVYKSDF